MSETHTKTMASTAGEISKMVTSEAAKSALSNAEDNVQMTVTNFWDIVKMTVPTEY